MSISVMPMLIMSFPLPNAEEWVARKNQLAHTLHQAADYEHAELEYRAILPWTNRRQRGVVLNNLAMLMRDQGRLDEALQMLEESLRIRRELGGETHPETLITLSNLGSLHGAMGRWKQAGNIFRQVLEVRRRVVATPSRELADTLVNVALVEKLEGRFQSALEHLEEALQVLPEGSARSSATIHHNIGTNLMAVGQFKRAKKELECALGFLESNHPIYAQVLLSLAALQLTQGHYNDAALRIAEAAVIEKQAFGPHHPRHASREKLRAWLIYRQGDWKQAADLLLSLPAKQLDEPDGLELRARIALKQKNEELAITLLEKGIALDGKHASMLRLYAGMMRKQQRYAEAVRAEQQVITLETRSALLGDR